MKEVFTKRFWEGVKRLLTKRSKAHRQRILPRRLRPRATCEPLQPQRKHHRHQFRASGANLVTQPFQNQVVSAYAEIRDLAPSSDSRDRLVRSSWCFA